MSFILHLCIPSAQHRTWHTLDIHSIFIESKEKDAKNSSQ